MYLTHAPQKDVELFNKEDKGRYIAAVRGDGLQVFLDKSSDPIFEWLNRARQTFDRKSVMIAVGMARGLQIAQNYADKYGTDEEKAVIAEQIENLCSNVIEFIPTQIEKT